MTISIRKNEPVLSAIICTYNRVNLLKEALESLVAQAIGKEQYELIVIDDGSSDETQECVLSYSEKLPLKYFFQKNAGLASAKNHGIFASSGDILIFLDDDDKLATNFLEQHLNMHKKYPKENFAVLNYTTWDPSIKITPLMEFIVGTGEFLFSYSNLKNNQILDYTYFWGGRSSCKRKFLLDHGVFNPVFKFGCEDIELGFRLSKFGMKVVFNKEAISYMKRSIDFDGFIKRLYKQGQSQFVFSMIHKDPEVPHLTETENAEEIWKKIGNYYPAKLEAAKKLDDMTDLREKMGFELDNNFKTFLYSSYFWIFKATKIKGIIEKKRDIEMGREKNKYSGNLGETPV
jgi:glycosyltransferase involved in cell wall biosynthesis